MNRLNKFIVSIILGWAVVLTWGGCSSVQVKSSEPEYKEKTGPPDHAPAHGYRKKFTYHYYPDNHVYYDIGRRLYFYMEGEEWKVGASLPGEIRIRVGKSVTLEMSTDTPYAEFKKHKAKYPPGKTKSKKNKVKGKKK